MKKILLLIGITACLVANGQRLKITDWPFQTSYSNSDRIFGYNITGSDTSYWQMYLQNVAPFIFSSPNYYTPNTSANFILGGSSNPLGFKLITYGNTYVSGDAWFNQNLKIGAGQSPVGRIWASGNDLWLDDASSSPVTLSQLIAASGSVSFSNGLTNGKLGGLLIENTDINLGSQTYTIRDPYNATYFNIGEGILGLLSSNTFTASSLGTFSMSNSWFNFTASSTGGKYRDLRATPFGLENYADYWAYILADSTSGARALMDYASVRRAIALFGGGASGDTLGIQDTILPNRLVMAYSGSTVTKTGMYYTNLHTAPAGYFTSHNTTVSNQSDTTSYNGVFKATKFFDAGGQVITSTSTQFMLLQQSGSTIQLLPYTSKQSIYSIYTGTANPTITTRVNFDCNAIFTNAYHGANVADSAYTSLARVNQLIAASGGGETGTEVANSADTSTNITVKVYTDIPKTSYDFLTITRDPETKIQMAEVAITSANIKNGDVLTIVSAPGTLKMIIPVKCIIYYDYSTAGYTSADANNSALLNISNNSVNIIDDIFEATEDYTFCPADLYGGISGTSANTINKAVTLDFYTHTGTSAVGTGKIKLWYYIVDFN